jgi:pre-mRNA cleavage complex 2 protein Pcf11
MYLLDSIVKNIGDVYIELFGKNLKKTFSEAYTKVDTVTKKSLSRLLKTWSGLPSGKPLFPVNLLRSIGEFMDSSDRNSTVRL